MTEPAEYLRRAAQARHEATMARAQAVLEALGRRSQPISFRHLARVAGVSRSWLYRQPELRQEIERMRKSAPPRTAISQGSQIASTGSLRQQLHTYHDEIVRLRAENAALKDQLARKLGLTRAASVTKTS